MQFVTLSELPALTETEGDKRVVLQYDGYEYSLLLQQNKIWFYDHSQAKISNENACIEIVIDLFWLSDGIYLDSYYFHKAIGTCPPIPHDRFFRLLKAIARVYDKNNVYLIDQSSKTFDHTDCRLSKDVFKLAGEPTFYERYGFVNKSYQDFMTYLRAMTFDECVHKFTLLRHVSTFRGHEEYHKILKTLQKANLNGKSTLQEIAAYVVRNCKQKSRHNTEHSRRSSKSMVKTRHFKTTSENYISQVIKMTLETIKQLQDISSVWKLKVLPDNDSDL